ncbi:hypothetical protein FJ251_04735 [bacterium]|nr:hypothetical protein [bacterium]
MHRNHPRGTPGLGRTLLAALLFGALLAPALRADEIEEAFLAARRELNAAQYERAVAAFQALRARFPESRFTADALYWEAFSRSRRAASDDLAQALDLLAELQADFPKAEHLADARELALRLETQLAKSGDAAAAYRVTREAEELAAQLAQTDERKRRGAKSDPAEAELELRMTALNALMQMDSQRALPILKRLLAERTPATGALRARALFILAQHDDPAVPALLVQTVREDPDPEVRQMAIFWLGQEDSPAAMGALKEVLADPKTDAESREQALFAVSQQESDEALAVLRQVARDPKVDAESRGRAIFWIGQRGGKQSAATLRELYGQLEDAEVKEQVLFAASQSGAEMQGWLLEVARNPKESLALRCRAVFWAGQLGSVPVADIFGLYQSSADRKLKEQVIFTLSQQRGDEAAEKLMAIVRQEQDPELRTMAVFWIGQSQHPRAAEFLEEIINK